MKKSIDRKLKTQYTKTRRKKRSHSSAGRASALQAGGHRFEPYSDHHVFYGPVVQLVRTLACHARGRRFEPVPGRHFFIQKLVWKTVRIKFNYPQFNKPRQLSWQSKGLKIPVSLVRFPFEAPKIVVSKLNRYYYFLL